jgi:hypothetical protein
MRSPNRSNRSNRSINVLQSTELGGYAASEQPSDQSREMRRFAIVGGVQDHERPAVQADCRRQGFLEIAVPGGLKDEED